MSTAPFFSETAAPADNDSPPATPPARPQEAITPSPSANGVRSLRPRRINPYKMFVGSFVPNWLLCRREVSQGAKLCYARLAQFAGEDGLCYPKQTTLAGELGVAERTARDYIRELEEFILIESVQIGLRKANDYYFLDHPWIYEGRPDAPATAVQVRQSSSGQERQTSAGQERRKPAAPTDKENQVKESQEKEETQVPRTPGIPDDESEAVEQAKLVGVPPEFARVEFCRLESVGWVNGAGNSVRKWVPHLRKRWADDQSQRAERKAHAAARPGRNGAFAPPRKFDASNYQQPVEKF